MTDSGSGPGAGAVTARLRSGVEMSVRAPGTEAEAVVDVVTADGGDKFHESTYSPRVCPPPTSLLRRPGSGSATCAVPAIRLITISV
jgi:hypothetical protein